VPTDILISSDPWENRVAIIEDGSLAEIYFEREEKVIGSIYKGRVQNVLPGMGASFVDIGLGRNAFLYVDDINKTPLNIGDVEVTSGRSGWTISEKISKGDDVLVQIVKEPRGLKGARISTNISLPGRYLILMPTGKYSGVSRKIDSSEERNRLKGIMKRIRPEGMATVVRTAAGNVSEAELIADLGVLIRMWHGILETYKRAQAPSLLHKDMNLVYKAARDFVTPDIDHVYIDDGEEYEKVRDFMRLLGPQYLDRIQHYNSGRSLFRDFKVDEEIQKLLRPKVNLPSGGSIVIETTEALTVIDVNSGKFTGGRNLEDTIVKTNIEAAAEIARQVRLRDIGGIIVCDFIDMNTESSRNKVLSTLEAGLRRDRTRTTIQSFSALGLLEFTRKRVGKDLAGQLRSGCPTCHGAGTVMSPESVTIETFRKIRHDADGKRAPVVVEAHPYVGAQMEFWYEVELKALAESVGPIEIRVDAATHPEHPHLMYAPLNGKVDRPVVRVGDECEVDLLNMRLPNPTSALAVVNGRLVEVENAAAAVGQTIKIRILDVDGEDVLAEPMTPVAVAAETRRRRRRGGRGAVKPITPEEQADELRELAEEAARGAEVRAGIGISTAAEAEAEEAIAKTPKLGPDIVGRSVGGGREDSFAEGALEDGQPRRRRRRRRRRGRGHGAEGGIAAPGMAAPAAAATSDAQATVEGTSDDIEAEPGLAAATWPPDGDEAQRRPRRRRRRRRRGHAGTAQDGTTTPRAVPDRHIFRVNPDGSLVATGETAPAEPSRAISPWRQTAGHVAIEAPPPALSAPPAPVDGDVRVTKPSRRRAAPRKASVSVSIEGAQIPALASGEAEEKPKRRTRKAVAAPAAESAKPKRARRTKAPAESAAAEAPKKRATRTRKKAEGVEA
jgi:ribonuclease G